MNPHTQWIKYLFGIKNLNPTSTLDVIDTVSNDNILSLQNTRSFQVFYVTNTGVLYLAPTGTGIRMNVGGTTYTSATIQAALPRARERKHYLDFLAFLPLEKLSLPTGLTHHMVC